VAEKSGPAHLSAKRRELPRAGDRAIGVTVRELDLCLVEKRAEDPEVGARGTAHLQRLSKERARGIVVA